MVQDLEELWGWCKENWFFAAWLGTSIVVVLWMLVTGETIPASENPWK
jgi:hypothetical protein